MLLDLTPCLTKRAIAYLHRYAYDADSLVALDALLPAGGNIIYNFHPYMGPVDILQNFCCIAHSYGPDPHSC